MKTPVSALVLALLFPVSFVAQQHISPGMHHFYDPEVKVMDVLPFDADGDGDLDLFYSTISFSWSGEEGVYWMENDGNGSYTNTHLLHDDRGYDLHLEDVDQNGTTDLVAGLYETVGWFSNLGGGSWSAANPFFDEVWTPTIVHTADVNADGYPDLIAAKPSGSDRIRAYPSDGAGGFDDYVVVHYTYSSPTGIGHMHVDDDGDMDLVISSGASDLISFFRNIMPVGFNVGIAVTTGLDAAHDVQVIDFDGDGLKDALAGANGSVRLCMNNGDESFTPIEVTTQNGTARMIRVGDMDLDGDLDIVSLWEDDGMVRYHEQVSPQVFETHDVICSEQEWEGLELGDFDGDGDLDIITSSKHRGIIEYRNEYYGCMDPAACNYSDLALNDGGGCCYASCGCTALASPNYDPTATCDDGSCLFRLQGRAWDDFDTDGRIDSWENGLAFQQILVPTSGLNILTNDDGLYYADVPPGLQTVVVTPNPNLPYFTTPQVAEVCHDHKYHSTYSNPDELDFGLSKDSLVYGVCIDLYPSGNSWPCNSTSNHNICFRNMGNTPISGIVKLTYDPLFTGYTEVTPIDSVVDNTIYMSFEDLQAGQMFMYDQVLHTPSEEHIGAYVHSSAEVIALGDDGVYATGIQELDMEVTCAYDPNDKQAFPLGYGDDHRLLSGEEQEFLVRFQNTGNAPATDVIIVDTMDVNFDLSTLEIVANSHSMMVQINEITREVKFQFYDIQLPDSTCCEPESHGTVAYKIRSLPFLPAETVLENTAYIFFDANPPIVTNTTWTTIHECGQDLQFSLVNLPNCPTAIQAVESNYVEHSGLEPDFYWTADGGLLSTEPLLELPTFYGGNIQLTVDNPLCLEMASEEWEPVLELEWLTCVGDINCDGQIGASDLFGLLPYFSCELQACPFDLNGDGEIGTHDMLFVLGRLGMTCD